MSAFGVELMTVSLMLHLAFRNFDSRRHTQFRVHSKICVLGKAGDIVKKSYKK